jgi:hypothetical protein
MTSWLWLWGSVLAGLLLYELGKIRALLKDVRDDLVRFRLSGEEAVSVLHILETDRRVRLVDGAGN